jgi:NhaP-type Na+/H+ or K+/H+ antiporter
MVLAGTYLTAVVGYYVFPFSWSWNLALTFGSILSATDPVAVSALLEEVGAPPRLKIHIGGESLLNDGSAMVFYTIFSSLFLTELGIKGVGESIDVAGGFALFFRMSLGGAAVGIAFAMGLIFILYVLNRRLTTAENVVQVCSTVTVAYLCYYTSDSVCGASGVIAVLTCGVLTQAFGSAMINDAHMMNAFWELVEQLLNTLLFTLGGLEFGGVISNYGERVDFWTASEWGYLILLWVLLHAIRFACVYSFYPVTSRLGLSTNWKECFFLSYGGLR